MSIVQLKITRIAGWDIGEQMFSILSEMLQPSTNTTLQTAGQSIDELYSTYQNQQPDHEKEAAAGSFLCEFWELVWKLASQLPHDGPQQENLIKFVKTLRDVPSRNMHDGIRVWEDLSEFSGVGNETI